MEELDDGSLSSWFKENYFDKNTKTAMTEHFNLNDNDIEKFTPKKRKKRQTKKKTTKKKETNSLDSIIEDEDK
jgi:hypothetical protein